MVHIWFKRLLIALASVSTAFMFLILGMLFIPEETIFFEFLTFLLGAMIFSLPFLLLGILATGLEILIKSNQKKKKKYNLMYEIGSDDVQLQYIMRKLSPEERTYLDERLAEREMGIRDDGEMVSIDELLSEFEEKSKRN